VRDPLLDAIVANPTDDEPRLVWADREGGERGELVVLQCRLAKRDLLRDERYRLRVRERELLLRHATTWANLGDLGRGTFVRGFVEHVAIELGTLARRADELFALAPLTRYLELRETSGNVNRYAGPYPHEAWAEIASLSARAFAALPEARITGLSASTVVYVSGDWADPGSIEGYGDAFAAIVAEAPTLRELAELTIYQGGITRDALPALAGLGHLDRLCAEHRLGGAGCVELLRAVPSLRRFAPWSGDPKLHGAELAILLAAPEVARLTELDLCSNQLGDQDLILLANTPALARLDRLGLGFENTTWQGFEAIMASPHLAHLSELELYNRDGVNLGAMASATFAPRLRRIGARYLKIDRTDIAGLLRLPALEHVTLNVTDTRWRAELEAVIPDVIS
jgi:uncharacterized protein (TIGR02996 family)